MDESKVSENHLTSAAAFVEGGIQDACDDACSICLEPFCDSDPSTLTGCKHEFHLQCVLEWCQRSSQCPMCWQHISLKDPGCQELLEAVEHERNLRMNPPRSTAIFHHPTLGDFELQHLPVNTSETELEERIIQHLAAAAAMGRARQLASREGRTRSSSQGRPHYLVFSTHANSASEASTTPLPFPQREGNNPVLITGPNTSRMGATEESSNLTQQPPPTQGDMPEAASSVSSAGAGQHGYMSNNWRTNAATSPSSQDRAGPSDLHSFPDTLKTRLTALSTRYKESISKSTRSWKERLFARNSSADAPPDVTREGNQSIPNAQTTTTLSRMMDHLQITEETISSSSSPLSTTEQSTTTNPTEAPSVTAPASARPLLIEETARATPNTTPTMVSQ